MPKAEVVAKVSLTLSIGAYDRLRLMLREHLSEIIMDEEDAARRKDVAARNRAYMKRGDVEHMLSLLDK
jgi:hypothetical protein